MHLKDISIYNMMRVGSVTLQYLIFQIVVNVYEMEVVRMAAHFDVS